MGSNPEALAELQRQAADRKKQDYINTNILNSNDPALQIAQDAIIGYAASEAVESVTIDVLRTNLIKALEGKKAVEIPFKNSIKVLKIGPKAIQKAIEVATKRAISKSVRAAKVLTSAPKLLKSIVSAAKAAAAAARAAVKAVRVTVAAAKAAVKAGEVMATSAIKGATVMGTICAATGAASGGLGCLVGVAVMVLQLAFDAFNLAMDIIDPNGYSVVIYKKDIEVIAQTTGEWVNKEYGEDNPNYLDEEVFFDWESHLYDVDDEGNIKANEEWATKYEKYRDEYMTNLGITGDWRSRIPSTNSVKATDPGVLSPLTLTFQEYKKEADAYLKSKKSSSSVLLFAVILFVILFLIFIFFFII